MGLTIFVCTPYMDEAERCNRIGLIYQGRIIASDTPANIKALIPGSLLEFHPEPEHFEEAFQILSNMDGALEIQTYGALLHVFVDQVELRRPQIEAALSARNISLSGMRQIEPRMEEAFISLITRQKELEGMKQ
jgi:ABC-2 type transport system ATP-binding protein